MLLLLLLLPLLLLLLPLLLLIDYTLYFFSPCQPFNKKIKKNKKKTFLRSSLLEIRSRSRVKELERPGFDPSTLPKEYTEVVYSSPRPRWFLKIKFCCGVCLKSLRRQIADEVLKRPSKGCEKNSFEIFESFFPATPLSCDIILMFFFYSIIRLPPEFLPVSTVMYLHTWCSPAVPMLV